VDVGEESDLLAGGAVVEGAAVVPGIGLAAGPLRAERAGALGEIHRFGPGSAGGLIGQYVGGEAGGLGAGVPFRWHAAVHLKFGGGRRCRFGPRLLKLAAFGSEHIALMLG